MHQILQRIGLQMHARLQPLRRKGVVELAPHGVFAWQQGQGVVRDLAELQQASPPAGLQSRSEEHTSELQSQSNLVCRLLLEKKKKIKSKLLFIRKALRTAC